MRLIICRSQVLIRDVTEFFTRLISNVLIEFYRAAFCRVLVRMCEAHLCKKFPKTSSVLRKTVLRK